MRQENLFHHLVLFAMVLFMSSELLHAQDFKMHVHATSETAARKKRKKKVEPLPIERNVTEEKKRGNADKRRG